MIMIKRFLVILIIIITFCHTANAERIVKTLNTETLNVAVLNAKASAALINTRISTPKINIQKAINISYSLIEKLKIDVSKLFLCNAEYHSSLKPYWMISLCPKAPPTVDSKGIQIQIFNDENIELESSMKGMENISDTIKNVKKFSGSKLFYESSPEPTKISAQKAILFSDDYLKKHKIDVSKKFISSVRYNYAMNQLIGVDSRYWMVTYNIFPKPASDQFILSAGGQTFVFIDNNGNIKHIFGE